MDDHGTRCIVIFALVQRNALGWRKQHHPYVTSLERHSLAFLFPRVQVTVNLGAWMPGFLQRLDNGLEGFPECNRDGHLMAVVQ
jgi:hypothetical protein